MDSQNINNLEQHRKNLKAFTRSFMLGQDCDASFNLGYITALYNHNLITSDEWLILKAEFVKFLHE